MRSKSHQHFDIDAIKRAAAGRWPEILSRLAGIPLEFLDGEHHPCPRPECGGTDRFRFTNLDGNGSVYCNQCGKGIGDGIAAIQWQTGQPLAAVLADVAAYLGLSAGGPGATGGSGRRVRPDSEIAATFDYRDEQFLLLYQVVRYDNPKDFRQRAPRPGGGWTWKTKGVRRVPYRLPELLAADQGKVVLIPEGEKHVDRLASLGFLATCNPGGAGKWLPKFAEHFAGRRVVVLVDNDEVGHQHGEQVAQALYGTAAAVKVLLLPGLPPKGDVLDWLDAGGTTEQLRQIIAGAPRWEPTAADEVDDKPTDKPGDAPAGVVEADDDPHRLARVFLDAQQPRRVVYWRDQWWQYTGTKYAVVAEKHFKAGVNAATKAEFNRLYLAYKANGDAPEHVQKVTRPLVSNIVAGLESLTACQVAEMPAWLGPETPPTGTQCVIMANGILDLDRLMADADDALLPHCDRWFSSICLPFPFDPDAGWEPLAKILDHNLEGDEERINLLQEWAGYCLLPDTGQQRFLVLEGEGANGKSVYCAALKALLGLENVSHVPLETFAMPFALTATLGKLANIAAECAELDKVAEGFLKSFTAGDPMTFNRKGLPYIEAQPTARLVLATNNRPRFSDRSGGLWRRMIVCPFRVEIQESERIYGMDKSDWWLATGWMPGVFNWAIEGLWRLRQRGKFMIPKLCRQTLEDYRLENNPARGFLEETCDFEVDASIAVKELYGHYKDWCKDLGYHPLGERLFGREVFRRFPDSERKQGGGRNDRFWYYKHLCYKGLSAGIIDENRQQPEPTQQTLLD